MDEDLSIEEQIKLAEQLTNEPGQVQEAPEMPRVAVVSLSSAGMEYTLQGVTAVEAPTLFRLAARKIEMDLGL